MNEDLQLKYAQLIASAWMDDQLMNRLREEPAAVLAEYGIVISGSENKQILLVEDTPETMHLVFPCKPDDEQTHLADLCCLPSWHP